MSEINVVYGKVLSSDGKNNIYYKVYEPSCKRIGVLQVVHGMTEYIDRYDAFMRRAAEEGFLCFGHDHVGHGHTAPSDDELGFIASENGDRVLVDDVGVVANEVKAKYGFEKRILMGHSMGSFVVRMYSAEHSDELSAAIFMGTGGSNSAAGMGRAIAKAVKKSKGERYISKTLDNMMFGSYNKKTENVTGRDWLTKDVEIQKKYDADKFCNYKFSVSAIIDLLNLYIGSNSAEWYKSVKADMPIYIVSGKDDPVGNYGKGPSEVYDKLIKSSHTSVTLKLWENDRHEILNETDKDNVMEELLKWAKKTI